MENRSLLQYITLVLKGMAMGAADVVPGVSGGTIAFISGIYEELIQSIVNIGVPLFKIWKEKGFQAFWKAANGNFLLALFSGIAISVFSLAKIISTLLDTQPVLVWSFFSGLILASVILISRSIENWNFGKVLALIFGASIAYYITLLPAAQDVTSLPFLFLSGSLAVCAMILPGISGAFILVLLGSYQTLLNAVHEMDFKAIIVFILGAIVGLLSIAKLLKWMFSKFKEITLALLTGFIIGSLNKLWPWKEVIRSKVIDGKVFVISEQNVVPGNYDGDPQVLYSIISATLGFLFIIALERLATRK